MTAFFFAVIELVFLICLFCNLNVPFCSDSSVNVIDPPLRDGRHETYPTKSQVPSDVGSQDFE